MLKTWQICPLFGNHAKNVANMPTVWQSYLKYGKHGHSVAIMLKMLLTCQQCGNYNKNVANMTTIWQLY